MQDFCVQVPKIRKNLCFLFLFNSFIGLNYFSVIAASWSAVAWPLARRFAADWLLAGCFEISRISSEILEVLEFVRKF